MNTRYDPTIPPAIIPHSLPVLQMRFTFLFCTSLWLQAVARPSPGTTIGGHLAGRSLTPEELEAIRQDEERTQLSSDHFPAYDCNHAKTSFVPIDLTEVHHCPDPVTDFENASIVEVQVLKRRSTRKFTATRCTVYESHLIAYCGYHSRNSATHMGETSVIDLAPNQCRDAVANGYIEVKNRKIKFQTDVPTFDTFFAHGEVFADGSCQGMTFTHNGQILYSSYDQVRLEVRIETIPCEADLDSNDATCNNVRTHYRDGVFSDTGSVYTWQPLEPPCNNKQTELYRGSALLHKRKDSGASRDGSILMIQVPETGQYAGFLLSGTFTLCTRHVYSTHLANLKINFLTTTNPAFMNTLSNDNEDPHEIHQASGQAYAQFKTGLQTAENFAEFQRKLCETERTLTESRLHALAQGDDAAFRSLIGPGYEAFVTGSVVHIAKCVAVEVTIREYPNCTSEIPVTYLGRPHFVNPFTRVLVEFSTPIICSEATPVMWKLDNRWHCSTPQIRPCLPPTQMNLTQAPDWHVDFTTGIGKGIYSGRALQDYQQNRLLMNSRDAVVMTAVVASVQNSANNPTNQLDVPLSDYALERLQERMSYHFFPILHWMGKFGFYFLGGAMVFNLAKIGFGCILRMLVTYQQEGCGFWCCLSSWATLHHMMMVPWNYVRAGSINVDRALDQDPNLRGPNDNFGWPGAPGYDDGKGDRDDQDKKPKRPTKKDLPKHLRPGALLKANLPQLPTLKLKSLKLKKPKDTTTINIEPITAEFKKFEDQAQTKLATAPGPDLYNSIPLQPMASQRSLEQLSDQELFAREADLKARLAAAMEQDRTGLNNLQLLGLRQQRADLDRDLTRAQAEIDRRQAIEPPAPPPRLPDDQP